ncbi:unnamed protein product, partial [marine sediment metagenome]
LDGIKLSNSECIRVLGNNATNNDNYGIALSGCNSCLK